MRTITLGISLLDCADGDLNETKRRIRGEDFKTSKSCFRGPEIEEEYGIPIVNKRISVTPISLVGGASCKTPEDFYRAWERLWMNAQKLQA